jgi:hypothetical protein
MGGATLTVDPQLEQNRADAGNPVPQRWQKRGITNPPVSTLNTRNHAKRFQSAL